MISESLNWPLIGQSLIILALLLYQLQQGYQAARSAVSRPVSLAARYYLTLSDIFLGTYSLVCHGCTRLNQSISRSQLRVDRGIWICGICGTWNDELGRRTPLGKEDESKQPFVTPGETFFQSLI
jgi:hypothetical protein